MQSNLSASTNSASLTSPPSETDPQLSNMKSPHQPSYSQKKPGKSKYNNENAEPNKPNLELFEDQLFQGNHEENKASSTTPIKAKQDNFQTDMMATTRDHNQTLKPVDSPYTTFCKGLQFSPGPFTQASPRFWNKGNLFSGSNFMSPIPFNLNLGFDTPSSPIFTKQFPKLDFATRLNIKPQKEEQHLEIEEPTDKFNDLPFEQNILSDEQMLNSPKFIFPTQKSIYSNLRLLSDPNKIHDLSNQSFQKNPLVSDFDKETALSSQQASANFEKNLKETEEATQPKINHEKHEANISSPKKNEPPENLLIQRNISFGADPLQNSLSDFSASNMSFRSSQKQKLNQIEEEEEGHEGEVEEREASVRTSASGQKKICCNCKKSKCLKLYCDCFARGKGCTKDCNCQNCLNNEANVEERKTAMLNTLERNPIAFQPKVNHSDEKKVEVVDKVRHIKGCNCKKSGCLKKYCECFQAGIKCSEVCKCENCKNMDHDSMGRKPHPFGNYISGTDAHKRLHLKLESPPLHSAAEFSEKFMTPNNPMAQHIGENDDDGLGFGGHNLRKHLITSKGPVQVPVQTNMHPEGEGFGEHMSGEKKKGHGRNTDKKNKANMGGQLRTPSALDSQKKNFDSIISPDKQSLSGGRARRNIRPLSYITPEEYEIGK